jgi:uncharacterized protein
MWKTPEPMSGGMSSISAAPLRVRNRQRPARSMTAIAPMIHPFDLFLPELPAVLDGFRIAHISDPHVTRHRPRHHRIAQSLRATAVDLALLTGDYMSNQGNEQPALEVMREICGSIRSRLGALGVFGNHDTSVLQAACGSLPVRWLNDAAYRFADLPLEVLGVQPHDYWPGDSLALLEHLSTSNGHDTKAVPDTPPPDRPIRLLLSHFPMFLPTAADLGVDIMFSGHTHGGQWRLPRGRALVNSSDLPIHLTSGVLRLRDTLCVVSRGLGESIIPVRIFCSPHIPVYTLRRGPMHGRFNYHVENVHPW